MTRRRFGWIALVPLMLALLGACAPAATVAPKPTQAAATKVPATAAPAPGTAAPAPTQAPSNIATPAPTQAGRPTPTPALTPAGEQHMLELEWPPSLRLGESDLVRLAVVPFQGGYVVQAEFPEHQVTGQQVTVARIPGYALSGLARLDGVGFEISPVGDQEQPILEGQPATWRWSLQPRAAGQQRLSILLKLVWQPEAETPGGPRPALTFSRGMDVQVSAFLGLTQAQAAALGFTGLVAGLVLSAGAVALRPASRRAVLRVLAPNAALQIEPLPGATLDTDELTLLRTIFGRYGRLVLENEFLSGYSGARTFLALPVRPDGRADAHTIVKVGWREDIQREAENYEAFVKDSLPPMTARIQHTPVTTTGSRRAAVQYTFIAEPGRPPISLRQALLDDPNPALLFRLFDMFGSHWWMQRRAVPFRLASEYDCVLPPHLVLEPAEGHPTRPLEETTPADAVFTPGELVRLGAFHRAERRAGGQSFTLYGQMAPGQAPLRLRWMSPRLPERTLARIAATRTTLFQQAVAGFDRFGLPDALDGLPALLNETLQGTRSIIHGDLNLENVLVGPGGFTWLIDFAQTREGHPLFDFAHLGAEMIAHILSPQYATPQSYAQALQAGQMPLFSALEQIAGRCLFNPTVPREFDVSLLLACLGALKYSNLSALARQDLYLTACWLKQKI